MKNEGGGTFQVGGSVADPGQYFPDPDPGLQEKPDPDPCDISPHELMNINKCQFFG